MLNPLEMKGKEVVEKMDGHRYGWTEFYADEIAAILSYIFGLEARLKEAENANQELEKHKEILTVQHNMAMSLTHQLNARLKEAENVALHRLNFIKELQDRAKDEGE